MDDERPSVTAEGAAVMRALHQRFDGDPKILDDPIAPRLVDPHSDFYQSRLQLLERLPLPTRLRLKSTFVMRSRFAEDCLAESFDQGVCQYRCSGQGWILLHTGSHHGPRRFAFSKSIILPLSAGNADS